ncbi:MAG: efflux RND transporter periplasmic adaptor subunit [Bacteroidales bacterium]|jgi:RND family efflux transporter MFP subunit|nr:efflux RND transporter periplasmic adaptor subunit [Bacteroidales bacterium]
MNKRLITGSILPAIFCFSFIAFSGCSQKSSQPEKSEVIFVKTETVRESDNMDILSYSGAVEDISSVALSFSSLGTIERILVSEGDFVSKGQLVASLDPTSAQNVLNAAGSALEQAKDGYERLRSIHEKGSLPDVQMVDIETRLNQAQSTYNIAKKNLENCSLYAPISGVVGRRMAEAGENAVIGKTVLTLMDISSVKVSFSVPENEIALIPSACESVITVSALGDRQFHGKRVDKNVIANPVSHTYRASVTLPNPRKELLPGMVCRIDLHAGSRESAIVVPINVVMASADGRKFVWCDEDGTARRRFITTGAAKSNGVEVKEGLSAGDRIVTEGWHKISDGDKISVR